MGIGRNLRNVGLAAMLALTACSDLGDISSCNLGESQVTQNSSLDYASTREGSPVGGIAFVSTGILFAAYRWYKRDLAGKDGF